MDQFHITLLTVSFSHKASYITHLFLNGYYGTTVTSYNNYKNPSGIAISYP